jgi:hypothetical protein
MKKTTVKILLMILIIFSGLFLVNQNSVYASEGSISVNNCNVGENFTVTVNIPQDAIGYEGSIKVTYSDGSSETSSISGFGWNQSEGVNGGYYWPGNASKTFSAKVAGNATVTVSGFALYNSNSDTINSNTTLSQAITINESVSQTSTSSSNSANTTTTTTTNLEFSNTNEKMYTTRRVNIRQGYGTSSNIIQTLAVGTELTRTGVSKGSADRIFLE